MGHSRCSIEAIFRFFAALRGRSSAFCWRSAKYSWHWRRMCLLKAA